MIKPEVPLKRKDQIALDEQIARDIQAKLDAELIEEQKLARKQEEEANIALIESWENTQAMMEADRLLAERLQSREREELTDEEKGKLFMELMEKRRKHFAALRAQEKRNRPPTKAQKRTQMSTYLKHMGGYTYKQLKGKSFDEIQKLFDKEMKRVNTFVAMGSEVQESKEKKVEGSEETAKSSRKKMLGRKRAGKEQQQESSKKQKVEKEKESDEVDEAELKKLLVIKKDKDIAIDAIPLATKLPVIIDYKLLKEVLLVKGLQFFEGFYVKRCRYEMEQGLAQMPVIVGVPHDLRYDSRNCVPRLRMADSHAGNHLEDDFTQLETIRRYNSTFGKKIPFELEEEAFELERRVWEAEKQPGEAGEAAEMKEGRVQNSTQWSNLVRNSSGSSRCTTLPGAPSRSPIGRTSWDGSWSQNFDLAPQMRSKLRSNIEKGIKQHFAKVYADNKSYLKRTYWSVKPGKMRDVESIRS
ncbi:hypothetical protein Tco_0047375 [Tanacetum coccineum]